MTTRSYLIGLRICFNISFLHRGSPSITMLVHPPIPNLFLANLFSATFFDQKDFIQKHYPSPFQSKNTIKGLFSLPILAIVGPFLILFMQKHHFQPIFSGHLCRLFTKAESEKPCQRVSNADRKVFANPESFCDMLIIG